MLKADGTWIRGIGHESSKRARPSWLIPDFSPTPGGQPAIPPTAASIHGCVSFEGTTETNNLECIHNVYRNSLPVDTWWIDAGWFSLVNNHWAASVGNFDPDPVRYPNGMDESTIACGERYLQTVRKLLADGHIVNPNLQNNLSVCGGASRQALLELLPDIVDFYLSAHLVFCILLSRMTHSGE